MSPTLAPLPSARLYAVVNGPSSVLLAVDEHDQVIAAGRPIAGWALHRTLEEVAAIAARFGAEIALVDEPLREPVPA